MSIRLPLYSRLIFVAITLLTFACSDQSPHGSVERLDAELDQVLSQEIKVEAIADGFAWSEGPVWVEEHNMLLFSDIPNNSVYKWTEEKGKELYLNPAGYTQAEKRGGETGSNGLILDRNKQLLLAQHGDRRIARMDALLSDPKPNYVTVCATYNGKKFNSPNDLVQNSKGSIFITDPPYGLEGYVDDPKKEISFQGIYKIDTAGNATLLLDSITRPNGIAFTPDEKKLVIANSDEKKKIWYLYDVLQNDSLANGRVIYDATTDDKEGNPDGLKFDSKGYMYATGPGGIWIFNPQFKLIGRINIGNLTSNCTFSPDEKTLYVTASSQVLRIRLRP